jgi:hypothetical protein
MGQVRSEFIDESNSSQVLGFAELEGIAEGSTVDGDVVADAVAAADRLRAEGLPLPQWPPFAANLLDALLEHLRLRVKAAEE